MDKPERFAGPSGLVLFDAGRKAGGPELVCAKRIPEEVAVMTDKPKRPGTILAEVKVMEINNVNSTAVLLASPVAESKQPPAPELMQAVKAINGAKLFGQDSELSFVMDREAKRMVIRLVNKETRAVIRQMPPEEVLRRAEDLKGAPTPGSFI